MSYLTATRYGPTKAEPRDGEREAGWRQVWEHPSGRLRAMRHPVTGYWVVSEMDPVQGWVIRGDGFASSLRAVAGRIERYLRESPR